MIGVRKNTNSLIDCNQSIHPQDFILSLILHFMSGHLYGHYINTFHAV